MVGTGGQGIMVMGQLLTYAAMREGHHVVWFPTYGPEARGGTAECTVIISSSEIGSPISAHPNTLIGMHGFLFGKTVHTVRPNGKLVVNSSLIDVQAVRDDCDIISIPANEAAEEIGNVRAANMVLLGAYTAVSEVMSIDSLLASLKDVLPPHRHALIPLNERAILMGMKLASRK